MERQLLPSVSMIQKGEFPSSSGMTPEQIVFNNAFRRDMRRILKDAKRIEFHRMHFEMSGFFETAKGTIYYFNTGDLRFFARQYGMLIRTAKDFKDYTGGSNGAIRYDERFEENLRKYADT